MKLFRKIISIALVCMLMLSVVSTACGLSVGAATTGVKIDGKTYDAKKGDRITYEVELEASKPFENIQGIVNYDPDVLEFVVYKYNPETGKETKVATRDMFPNLTGVVYNYADAGVVKFNASLLDRFDFTAGSTLLKLDFIVKADATTDISLNVLYMTIDAEKKEAYFSGGEQLITSGISFDEDLEVAKFTPEVTLSQVSYAYDGKAKTPEVKVVSGDILLKEGSDYTVAYSDNIEAGTAKATVTYKGSYTGMTVKTFSITRGFMVDGKEFEANIGDKITYAVDITAAKAFENIQAIVSYDPEVLELVNTKYDSESDKEYTLTAHHRIENLTGVVLNTADLGFVKFNASNPDCYDFTDGKNLITLEFIVKNSNGCGIILDIQEMTINAEAKQSYFSGSKPVITDGITVSHQAQVTEFEPEVILTPSSFIYDGKAKTPEVKVVFADILLREGSDYSVSYADNVKAGSAKATVIFSGNYRGEVTKNFAIVNGYIDPDTDIIVDETKGKEINIVEVKSEDKLNDMDFDLVGVNVDKAFDISLIDKNTGAQVQPEAEMNVRIPCDNPEGKIYMTDGDGKLADMKAAYEDGYLVFATKRMGMCVVAVPSQMWMLGDANGDTSVNIKDVTAIQKNVADIKTDPLTGIEFVDVNSDKAMNIKDATAIQKYIASIATGYPIGEPLK